jgi:hypothetical protein
VDAALADYIKQFAAGALEFAADTENEGHGSIAPDGSIVPDDASSADTVGAPSPTSFYKTASASSPRDARRAGAVEGSPRPGTAKRPTPSANEMREGDLVRLKHGLEGSSVLVSQRNSDNTVSSQACLGSWKLGRIGVVVRAASNSSESPEPPPIIWVAHVSSGHLCEYLASDLVFADSSSLDTLPSKPAPQPASKKAQKIVVGSKVELTSDYTSYSDAASGPLKPGEIAIVTADILLLYTHYYLHTLTHTYTHTHTHSLTLSHSHTLTHTHS